MRIIIESPEEVTELVQARQVIDALLHSLMCRESERIPAPPDDRSVMELDLGVRTRNSLLANNIGTLDLLVGYSAADLMRLPGFGRKSLDEVTGALESIGKQLQLDHQEWPQ